VPVFFLAREFATAALRTELPKDLVLAELQMPFSAFVLMLPRGFIRHPTEGGAAFLAMAKLSDALNRTEIAIAAFTHESGCCTYRHTTNLSADKTLAGAQKEMATGQFKIFAPEMADCESDEINIKDSRHFMATL
jgi:hypothetical protein